MQTTDDTRQQLIRSALPDDGVHSPSQCIELAMRRWRELAVRLIPLVGEAGFSALYRRALRRAATDHSCLAISERAPSNEGLFEVLARDLDGAGTEAAAVNAALLDTFTALLAALIGGELSNRILMSAWGAKLDEKQDAADSKEVRK